MTARDATVLVVALVLFVAMLWAGMLFGSGRGPFDDR